MPWNRQKSGRFMTAMLAMAINGCVSAVPGTRYGGMYCLQTYYSDAYQDKVKWSRFDYGGYKDYSAGSNGALCSLREFHTLYVRWETTSGVHRTETVDIAPLVEKMRATRKIPISFSPPELRLEIIDRTLNVYYGIFNPDPKVDRREWHLSYPLYSRTQ